MKIPIVIVLLGFSLSILGQGKTNKLTLHFDDSSIPYNFYKEVVVKKGDSIVGKSGNDPYRNILRIPISKNTTYDLILHTYFNDSIIKEVDLRNSHQDVEVENIYEEVSNEEMKSLINQQNSFNIYKVEYHTEKEEHNTYTITNAAIRLDYKLGSVVIYKNDPWRGFLNYRLMTYKMEEKFEVLLNEFLSVSCALGKSTKRKKNKGRYPNIVLVSNGKFALLNYCDRRKSAFENLIKWIEDNKKEIFEM
ncbi:hypothetical protein [Labilibacter marinus]|uniref:hypothetical protein n=1 Tax=Labilibacter marinus TaxID=1477105 RepID=UPI0009501252|nr:hypothetical protein [Labilibacter marinus]